jgi:hypothetical protein
LSFHCFPSVKESLGWEEERPRSSLSHKPPLYSILDSAYLATTSFFLHLRIVSLSENKPRLIYLPRLSGDGGTTPVTEFVNNPLSASSIWWSRNESTLWLPGPLTITDKVPSPVTESKEESSTPGIPLRSKRPSVSHGPNPQDVTPSIFSPKSNSSMVAPSGFSSYEKKYKCATQNNSIHANLQFRCGSTSS